MAEGAGRNTRIYVRRIKVAGELVDEDWRELSPEEIEAERQKMLAEMHEQTERFAAWCDAEVVRIRQDAEIIAAWKEACRG